MDPRRFLPILAAILLAPVLARADTHKADILVGFSLAKGSLLPGVHVSVGWTLGYWSVKPQRTYKRPWTLVGDFAWHRRHGHRKSTFLIGGRYTPLDEKLPWPILGLAFQDDTEKRGWQTAAAVGGSWDQPSKKPTDEGMQYVARLQGYLLFREDGQTHWLASAGGAFRFPRHHDESYTEMRSAKPPVDPDGF